MRQKEVILSLSDQRKFHQIQRDCELDSKGHNVCKSGEKSVLGWILWDDISKARR